jgi:hypothetical protein
MRIVPRAEWGASPQSLPDAALKSPATTVIVHHSVTAVTPDPYSDMRVIERIGIERYGQISYNYVIHPHDGEILEGCGLRRGAHTEGRNSTAVGICWAGNYNDRQPKVQQLDATRWLIGELIRFGHLVAEPTILGHSDVGATACPGSKLHALLDVIRHPWEETMPDNLPDNPDLPNLPEILGFYPVINAQTGDCRGYYVLSPDGQLHAFGPGAPYFGRSEVVT